VLGDKVRVPGDPNLSTGSVLELKRGVGRIGDGPSAGNGGALNTVRRETGGGGGGTLARRFGTGAASLRGFGRGVTRRGASGATSSTASSLVAAGSSLAPTCGTWMMRAPRS